MEIESRDVLQLLKVSGPIYGECPSRQIGMPQLRTIFSLFLIIDRQSVNFVTGCENKVNSSLGMHSPVNISH